MEPPARGGHRAAAAQLVRRGGVREQRRGRAARPLLHLGHAAAVLGGHLYALGGLDAGNNKLNTVERYDPVADAWEFVAAMAATKSSCAVAVLEGKIYVTDSNRHRLQVYQRTS